MKLHEKVDHAGMRIQQTEANYGKTRLCITIAENLASGGDVLVWCADTQEEVDSHWAAAMEMFGPDEDDGA